MQMGEDQFTFDSLLVGLSSLSLAAWIFLAAFRGGFWKANQRLSDPESPPDRWPTVSAIIPARNEEKTIATTLHSLLTQDYPGKFNIYVVDDNSEDNTVSQVEMVSGQRVNLVAGSNLPEGWTGKLWALQQGVISMNKADAIPDYILFTDADIEHSTDILRRLVKHAEDKNLDLVSLMVLLRCRSLWEVLLIPAFVLFFQKLYPFPWVNDPARQTAGAAGGCILLRRTALENSGGLAEISDQVIDDCSLARQIKVEGPIWLGLTEDVRSLRGYTSLGAIWSMVIRTAFDQLNYSAINLIGSLVGMLLLYITPPFALVAGIANSDIYLFAIAALTWSILSLCYWPTLRLYKRNCWEVLLLPAAAFLYTTMTLDSALRHWTGRGPRWKGRKNRPGTKKNYEARY